MESLDPLVNLLTVLTALSVVAERVTNYLKLRNVDIRGRQGVMADDRSREQAVTLRSLAVGVGVAVFMKADMFAIVVHLDDPWRTLGWVRMTGGQWFQTPATSSLGTALYTVVGCVLTGVALGFGSKFWHDVLGSVYEVKRFARRARSQPAAAPPTVAEGHGDG